MSIYVIIEEYSDEYSCGERLIYATTCRVTAEEVYHETDLGKSYSCITLYEVDGYSRKELLAKETKYE